MDLRAMLQARRRTLRSCTTTITNNLGERFEVEGQEVRRQLGSSFPFVVDAKPDLQVARITDELFLSSQDPLGDLELLKSHGINSVLSLGVQPSTRFPTIRYHFFDILDLPEFPFLPAFGACARIIDDCSRSHPNVLVHCNAGVSRSVAVVTGYLMLWNRLSYEEAFASVKAVRPCARPNDGFVAQLRELESSDHRIPGSLNNPRPP